MVPNTIPQPVSNPVVDLFEYRPYTTKLEVVSPAMHQPFQPRHAFIERHGNGLARDGLDLFLQPFQTCFGDTSTLLSRAIQGKLALLLVSG